MIDGIRDGFAGGLELLGWLLGFLGPFLVIVALLAALVWLGMIASVDIPHHVRVRRIRRQARRSGRGPTVAEQLNPLFQPPERR